jgi:hypothetical protein
MSRQVMKVFTNNDCTISQLLDYGLYKYARSEQNFVNLMNQHKTEVVYNVNNTKSSNFDSSLEKLDATST